MLAIDIEPGDELHNAADELVWTVLWTWEYDRTTKGLRIRWASDQGETDRAYGNDVELNMVRPTPPPPPEDSPADPEDPPVEPEEPPADPEQTPLHEGENTVTPDPDVPEQPAGN
jgi:hypothetical protein